MPAYTSAADGSLMLSGRAASAETPRCCRAELSNDLLDEKGTLIGRLIDFAFDMLGAQALDVRVTTAMGSRLMITVQDGPVSSCVSTLTRR
jgi:hypothetical protein